MFTAPNLIDDGKNETTGKRLKIETKTFAGGTVRLWHKDWFNIYQSEFEQGSIDLVITSPPYGILEKAGWDYPIDLHALEGSFNHALKDNGLIIIFCNLDLMTKILSLCQSWEKRAFHIAVKSLSMPVNELMPLPDTEFILIMKKKGCQSGVTAWHPYAFHPVGKPYFKTGKILESPTRRHVKNPISENKTGKRFITQSLPFTPKCQMLKAERSKHPTQLPETLIKGLIRTYSNDGDTVLDPFMGSGSAVISAVLENRIGYGVERDKTIYDEALHRIRKRSGVHQEKLAFV